MGGARWDDWRTRCPLPGRRSVAADVPARLAQRLQRSRPNDHEQRRLCGRRDTERSEWRGGRAAANTSMNPAFRGPAPGMAGDRGGDLAGAAPSGAQRNDLQAGQFAKRASVMHRMTDEEARVPRPRERAAPSFSRLRRPDRMHVRDGSPSGARHRYPEGSTRSATARPRTAGTRPGPPGSDISDTTSSSVNDRTRRSGTRCSNLGESGPVARIRTSDTTRPSLSPPSPHRVRSGEAARLQAARLSGMPSNQRKI